MFLILIAKNWLKLVKVDKNRLKYVKIVYIVKE